MEEIPKFNIEISTKNLDEQKQGILKLLNLVKPEWNSGSVNIEKMTGGVVNHMFKCFETDISDAIVVRVYLDMKQINEDLENVLDHLRDLKNIKYLRKTGLGPEPLCYFNNGVSYEYIHGELPSYASLRSDKMLPYVTKLLATLNALPPVEWSMAWDEFDMDKIIPEYPPKLKDPEQIKRLLKLVPDRKTAFQEFDKFSLERSKLRSPKMFCHNDTKAQNFIWNEEMKMLRIIDLEHAGTNFQCSEIAAHFISYTNIDDPKPNCFPDRDFQIKWIKMYLKYYYEAIGRIPEEAITEKEVETLYVEANKVAQAIRFSVGICCLPLVEKGIFDCFEFCMIHLEEYEKYKEYVDSLTVPE